MSKSWWWSAWPYAVVGTAVTLGSAMGIIASEYDGRVVAVSGTALATTGYIIWRRASKPWG